MRPALRTALYPAGATTPRLSYSLKPALSADVQSLHLEIDGKPPISRRAAAGQTVLLARRDRARSPAERKIQGRLGLRLSQLRRVVGDLRIHRRRRKIPSHRLGRDARVDAGGGRQGRPVTGPNGQPLQVRFDLDMGGRRRSFRRDISLRSLVSRKSLDELRSRRHLR